MLNGTSWQTSAAGIIQLVSIICAILTALLTKDYATAIAIVTGGQLASAWGHLASKDKNVTGAGDAATTVKQ